MLIDDMFRYLKAVLWSFLGLREKHAFETDQKKLKPIILITVGILVSIAFIVALIGVVQIVVSNQQQILESSEGRS
ncbi:DUF2970 domain-containing protein [Betaproteobacteria bacterium]|nr:DUF2970 domain-containing protein [Betaproteobacteria bacterium]